MIRQSALIIAVLFCFGASASVSHAQLSERIGLVKDRPAEGPFVETDHGFMVPYTETIPGTEISFEMVPIPGGTFKIGSPEDEEGRYDEEGPQVEIVVEPFWMGKYEVTWKEYSAYMSLHDPFVNFVANGIREIDEETAIDVISAPSKLYDTTFTYSAGSAEDQPAVTMTQYAAKQYTKWISLLLNDFYRIPAEAEWEYACRAGTTTAYSFGDDPSMLGDYAWYADNSEKKRHAVGQKLPNPWGLYDMHGNAAEWVLDEYTEAGYEYIAGDEPVRIEDAIQWPYEVYPRVVRGGSWELEADELRCAARLASDDENWKDKDPNFPLSPWWFTTSPSTGVGMRIMRPLVKPEDREAMEEFWKADNEEIELDVEFRIDSEGRGARGRVDPLLPNALRNLRK